MWYEQSNSLPAMTGTVPAAAHANQTFKSPNHEQEVVLVKEHEGEIYPSPLDPDRSWPGWVISSRLRLTQPL